MERREQCRVPIGPDSALRVSFLAAGGSLLAGRLVDLSFGGAQVRFFAGDFPRHSLAPAVGETVELGFPSALLNRPLVASARVTYRTDEDRFCRCGFRFTDPGQFERRLWPMFRRLFNRRRAVRIALDPGWPAWITRDAVRVEAPLVDISTAGVAVSVPPDVEAALASADRIRLCIPLSESGRRLELDGRVRSRRLAGGQIHYGIEFDRNERGASDLEPDAIAAFVTTRQQALPPQAKAA
ncbi:MAG: PilZ domain-containing protein [Planctomycetota bacterium]|jgi:c-di-GMP-binding flagellar brake protein YcgR